MVAAIWWSTPSDRVSSLTMWGASLTGMVIWKLDTMLPVSPETW
jgi:hypothetical protein